MLSQEVIEASLKLDKAGLVWHPEIGDEVAERTRLEKVAILVDPQGLSPTELRQSYLWLPNVEQLVEQLEARQALIYHAGITEALAYQAVIRTGEGVIEASAATLRIALSKALERLLTKASGGFVH